MTSFAARLVRWYIIWIRRSKALFGSAENTRNSIQAFYLRPQSFLPPQNLGQNVVVDRVDVNECPLYRVSANARSNSKETRSAMLYAHGGAFYREIDPLHWKFVAQVARDTGLDVLVPIYPLIPRPTATAEKIVAGFIDICRLSEQRVVCLAGDSAGGHLALATAQQMREREPDLGAHIQCIVLISPVLDSALDHPEVVRFAEDDPWLAIDGLRVLTPHLSGGLPIRHPFVSPLYGDIDHLPPVLLLSGTSDMLCGDARRLSARFQGKDANDCVPGSVQLDKLTYVEHAEMIHVYPLLPHAEGAEARELIMSFIRKNVE